MAEEPKNHLRWLYKTLDERKRPEDVANVILKQLDGQLIHSEEQYLQKAAKDSLRETLFSYTSMLQNFVRPVGLKHQVANAENIFKTAYRMSAEMCDNPQDVEMFIRHISQEIDKLFGKNDFINDRLNREARENIGMEISRRRYNKLFRHLTRMEYKLQTLLLELKKLEFTKIGKSGLAHKLSWEEFANDVNSACFIAYYTARCNLRSEFIIYGQQRPYDEIADMLFTRCKTASETNWWAIAHVYPHYDVLNHLSDKQKGELLGKWFNILQEISSLLMQIWEKSDINRETMVVQRGNDSSTWNNTANAWNKARDNWIALLYAMGLEDMLETMCFGKVLRLMAADVVAWHFSAGGGLDPNTLVWTELPLPWEVLSGEYECTLKMVVETCNKHRVDPIKSGWIGPRPNIQVAKFRPTPELVHGVSVESPFLAKTLRKRGFFSGKVRKRFQSMPAGAFVHGHVLEQHHKRLTNEDSDLE